MKRVNRAGVCRLERRLVISLSHLPVGTFEVKSKEISPSLATKRRYRANFTLEMVVESASLRFEIYHQGQLISTHRVGDAKSVVYGR